VRKFPFLEFSPNIPKIFASYAWSDGRTTMVGVLGTSERKVRLSSIVDDPFKRYHSGIHFADKEEWPWPESTEGESHDQ
jgi:hypothetical protein